MPTVRNWIGAACLLAALAPAGISAAPLSPTPTPRPAPLPLLPPDSLAGKPFPPIAPSERSLPAEKRTFFAAPGPAPGDGSEARPWNDLQAALRALSPGDRLRVRAGQYAGPLRIDEACRDGAPRAPIQVVFDGKATLEGSGDGAVLTLTRAHWLLVGAFLKLEDSDASGVSIDGPGAHDVTLDGARVSGGRGPSVRIGGGAARISIVRSNLAKSTLTRMAPSSVGIEIAAGAAAVLLGHNHLHENPAGSIRVQAPAAGGWPARNIRIIGNRIYDDGATAIDVAAADDLLVAENILSDTTSVPGTRAVALGRVRRGVVRFNRASNFGVGIHLGHAEPDGSASIAAENVTITRNHLETGLPGGTAVVIEAAARVVVANNVVDGYASGILVFGKPPQTRDVSVANNLVLGVSDVAVLLADPAAAAVFDYNVFSPAGPVLVEVGGVSVSLARWLKEGKMPHSQLKPGVRILYGDLARVSGAETVDRGTALEGVSFQGSAPDIGVAER